MFRLIIAIAATLFLAGCGTSLSLSLTPNMNGANFTAAKCQSELPLKYIGSSYEHGRISLKRSFYQNGEDFIVHEHGRLDDRFEFVVSLDSLAVFAFELKNAQIMSLGNFHTYLKGTSQTGKPVYIIAAGIGPSEDFNVLYGDKEEIVEKLALCIKNGESVNIAAKSSDKLVSDPRSYIRSDFGAMLFFKHDIAMSKGSEERLFSR